MIDDDATKPDLDVSAFRATPEENRLKAIARLNQAVDVIGLLVEQVDQGLSAAVALVREAMRLVEKHDA